MIAYKMSELEYVARKALVAAVKAARDTALAGPVFWHMPARLAYVCGRSYRSIEPRCEGDICWAWKHAKDIVCFLARVMPELAPALEPRCWIALQKEIPEVKKFLVWASDPSGTLATQIHTRTV